MPESLLLRHANTRLSPARRNDYNFTGSSIQYVTNAHRTPPRPLQIENYDLNISKINRSINPSFFSV